MEVLVAASAAVGGGGGGDGGAGRTTDVPASASAAAAAAPAAAAAAADGGRTSDSGPPGPCSGCCDGSRAREPPAHPLAAAGSRTLWTPSNPPPRMSPSSPLRRLRRAH